MHAYFISYKHSEGFGNLEVYTKEEINDIAHIREIENTLNEGNAFDHKGIIILNFQLLRFEDEENLSGQIIER
jgi:hypothetical protein